MARGDLTVTMDTRSMLRLEAQLARLTEFEKQEVVARGVREATAIIKKEGQKNLTNEKTGLLKKSFTTRVDKKKLKGYAGFIRRKGYHGAIAHLIDRGHKIYFKDPLGKRRKKPIKNRTDGTFFWTKAVESKGNEAMRIMAESIQKTIKRLLNR